MSSEDWRPGPRLLFIGDFIEGSADDKNLVLHEVLSNSQSFLSIDVLWKGGGGTAFRYPTVRPCGFVFLIIREICIFGLIPAPVKDILCRFFRVLEWEMGYLFYSRVAAFVGL